MFGAFARIGVVVLIIPLLSGCGVQLGQDNSAGPVELTTAFIRIRQPGDFWKYDDRRDVTVNGQAFTLVGTLTGTLLADTITDYVGNTAGIISLSTNFTVLEDESTVVSVAQLYISQDADGSQYVHGGLDDSVQPPIQRFVVTPAEGRALLIRSPVGVGSVSQTAFIEFDDGTTQRGSTVGVAVEEVSVPAGRFVALRIEDSATFTTGSVTTTIVDTSWFVPELGAAARIELNTTIRDTVTGDVTTISSVAELVETNVFRDQ